MAFRLVITNKFWSTVHSSVRPVICLPHRTLTFQASSLNIDTYFKPLTPEEISPKTDYEIAGRKWLPGSQGAGFPEHLRKPREGFPHALQVLPHQNHSLSEWAQIVRQVIDDNLHKYGTMVLRGLPLVKNEAISEFSKSLGYKSMRYPSGGAADRSLHDADAQVYTASNEPPEYTIELHNELGYLPTFPRKLIFYCIQEPAEGCGGLTVICDTKEFMGRLDPKVSQKLEEKQISYHHRLPDESKSSYVSWQQTFKTQDIEDVKKFLEKGGYEYSINEKDSIVSFRNTLPAFRPHPDTGEKIWFNSVNISQISSLKESPMYPGDDKLDTTYTWDSTYGDGSPIEPDVIQHVRACLWQSTYGFQWKTSDMLVVDNMIALHGRLSYTGNRKILAFLMAD